MHREGRQRWYILGTQIWSGDLYICSYYSMYTEREMTFPSPFTFLHTKVAPPPPFTNCVIYPISVSLLYAKWRHISVSLNEHWIQKTQTNTIKRQRNLGHGGLIWEFTISCLGATLKFQSHNHFREGTNELILLRFGKLEFTYWGGLWRPQYLYCGTTA